MVVNSLAVAANKTLLALPSVAGTLTRGLARFARILAHMLAPQSLALEVPYELRLAFHI